MEQNLRNSHNPPVYFVSQLQPSLRVLRKKIYPHGIDLKYIFDSVDISKVYLGGLFLEIDFS